MGLQVAAAGKIINEFTGLAFAGGEFETDNPAIRFVSAEAWTRDAQGAHITFATAPIGTSSPVEGMRLTSEGILLVGTDTASGSAKLQVSGAINVSGITYAGTLFTINGDGTATLYNQTATTGSTSLAVRAGAGQSTNALTTWQNNAGTTIAYVGSDGSLVSSAVYVNTAAASTTSLNLTDNANYTLRAGYTASGAAFFGGLAGTSLVLKGSNTEVIRLAENAVGFFGVTPVAKQTVTADAASILAALQAYGLAV